MKILIPKESEITNRDIIFGHLTVDTNKRVMKIDNSVFSIDEQSINEILTRSKLFKKEIVRTIKVHPVRIWKNQRAIVSDSVIRHNI